MHQPANLQASSDTGDRQESAHAKRDADLSQVQVIEAEVAPVVLPPNETPVLGEAEVAVAEVPEAAAPADPKQHIPRARRASRVASTTEAPTKPIVSPTDAPADDAVTAGAKAAASEPVAATASGGNTGNSSDNEDWAAKEDTIVEDAAEAEDMVISGWLKKAGDKNTKFKDRFFVIDGDVFRYYTDDKSYDDAQPPIKNNTVPIPQYTCKAVAKDKSNKRMQLVPLAPSSAKFGSRVWAFEAHDTTARDFWIQAFWTAGAAKQDA